MNLSFHALAWPCVAQAHFVCPTSGHFVQRCRAAPQGAVPRQLSILFSINPSTETKWRTSYNKAYYSLDCDDGIEYSACLHEPSPQELMDRKELFFRLWNALNSLPEIQGRRVDAHLILGKSYRQIAREEGVDKSAVRCSVKCGIEGMKKYLQENF